MVARVAITADRILAVDSMNVRISNLQFKRHEGIDSDISSGMGTNRDEISYSTRESESEKQTMTVL